MAMMVLAAAVLLMPGSSKADTITTTATYADHTKGSAFSGSDKTISFTMDVPGSVGASMTDLKVPIKVTYNGSKLAETGEVDFFSSMFGGLFDISFSAGGKLYEWDFLGAQIYNSSKQLTAGTFPINIFGSVFYKGLDEFPDGMFTWGTVVVTKTTSVPEPTSLLLLGMGLVGLLPAARKRFAK
jgi:hypothetical protein